MFTIQLKDVSKKFSNNWIFRNINAEYKSGDRVAVTGFNGSGKSTLLQLIAGYQTLSEGIISFTDSDKKIPVDDIPAHISYAAPYMDVIEEFSLEEMINFYSRFKSLTRVDLIQVSGIVHKGRNIPAQIKFFSSGMKQRLKLTLAFLSETPVVLLDEPLSNLDSDGINWYGQLFEKYGANRIVIISSNKVNEEISFCNSFLNIEDFKN